MRSNGTRQRRGPGTAKALFPLGTLVTTPGAQEALALAGGGAVALSLLRRHVTGDWDELTEHDRDENWLSVTAGLRILSFYTVQVGGEDVKLWVITEADRSATTFLLPEEY